MKALAFHLLKTSMKQRMNTKCKTNKRSNAMRLIKNMEASLWKERSQGLIQQGSIVVSRDKIWASILNKVQGPTIIPISTGKRQNYMEQSSIKAEIKISRSKIRSGIKHTRDKISIRIHLNKIQRSFLTYIHKQT